MKWLQRFFVLLVAAGVLMAPQTSQITSYVNGNVLTADQLNSEFGNLYSTINALDEDNFLTTTSFPATYLASTAAGDGLARVALTGVLSVGVDGVGIEINTDALRLKALGVTTAKLANDAVTAAKVANDSLGDDDLSNSTVLTIGAGAAATPTYSFSGDANTGFYSAAADSIGIATGGGAKFTFNSSNLLSTFQGSAAAPVYQIDSAATAGIYAASASSLGVSAGGSNAATFSATAATFPGTIETASGGAFKVKIVTIGTSSSTGTTLSTAHGLTLANIVTILGGQYDATNSQVVGASSMGTTAASSSQTATYFADGTNVYVTFAGAAAVSKVYKAMIFYQ